MRALSLAIVLFAFWLALSGHYSPFLISTGAVTALVCVYVAARMRIVDEEGHPIHLMAKGVLSYFVWLFGEIMKSAWSVTRIILDPRLPISPTMTKVKAGQKTPVGVDIYANSITLTPGTITVGIEGGDMLIVHALQSDGARDLESGHMDARVTRFEDG